MAGKLMLDERTEFDLILGKANTALTGADATVRWDTNRAVSAGTAAIAAENGANLVWIPERDACLHCLAYAGWVTEVGTPFPAGLTYADKPLKPYGDLLYPPLHPNCRCQVDVTYLPPGRSDESLAREADRSVARGLSNYASEPAALRAADRLLQSPNLLPKSVRERARRNVDAGSFKARPKGSDWVPGGPAKKAKPKPPPAPPKPKDFSKLPAGDDLVKVIQKDMAYPVYPPELFESLADYQGSFYRDINKALREKLDQEGTDIAIKDIDKVFELTPGLARDVKVFRGMRTDLFSPASMVGQTLRDLAYSSSSIKLKVAQEFSESYRGPGDKQSVIFEILLPKGLKAIPVQYVVEQMTDGYQGQPTEKQLNFYEGEMLLPRGMSLKIVSDVTDEKGLRTIQAEASA